jgi:sigma-B regulation protein RsbU (phosphoserine phosphatase)
MQGEINGVALELAAADGGRLPVPGPSTLKTGDDGQPLLIRTTVVDAASAAPTSASCWRPAGGRPRARPASPDWRRPCSAPCCPPALPAVPGLEGRALPPGSTDEVGGDFYDLFRSTTAGGPVHRRRVRQRAGAAVVTSLARYTLRAAAVHDPDPVAVLAELNARTAPRGDSSRPTGSAASSFGVPRRPTPTAATSSSPPGGTRRRC